MSVIDRVAERVRGAFDRGRVETVFGEPRTVDGVEVIPVAKVRGGFGFGGGSNPTATDGGESQEGGGGGGGIKVTPVAIVRVRDGEPEVIPVIDRNAIIRGAMFILAIVAIFAGLVILRRTKR